MTPWIVSNLWIVPGAPLAASLLILAVYRHRRSTQIDQLNTLKG